MAELFLEIFSEEIPARMQAKARDDLERLVCAELKAAGLAFDNAVTYTTPRRLVLKLDGVPLTTPDVSEERRGPRADAPDQAIEGFLRGAGLTREDLVERADKKGTFLYAIIEKKGGKAAQVISDFMPGIIHNFPWPKSQRWGSGALRWVRPLHSIVCLLDGEVVSFEVDDIKSDHFTSGHRFMAPEHIAVSGLEDYKEKLRNANVVLDHSERADTIRKRCIELAKEKSLEWVEDGGLLREVAGLVEWPVPLIGSFDPAFMEVPEEVLILTMKKDQKYFVLRDPKTGKLAPHFITVSNIDAKDGGDFVRGGNERVLSARLSDAKFFWDQDLKGKLEDNLPKLEGIIFHDKLGTVAERVDNIVSVSGFLCSYISDVDRAKAVIAAKLCKADLVSGMVNEFPELQGIIGGYYAEHEGYDPLTRKAIQEHYSPAGVGDECPTSPESIVVALADKLVTLVGFFGIDQAPTGSKDPFALRRAALGVIELITINGIRLPLLKAFEAVVDSYFDFNRGHNNAKELSALGNVWAYPDSYILRKDGSSPLLDFFAERLKVQQLEKGVRHDLIDAAGSADDLVLLLSKVKALSKFVSTDDGVNLLAGYKRAANILRIEEKKDKVSFNVAVKADLLAAPEEIALSKALEVARAGAAIALKAEDFEGAMSALSKLRGPTDAFFDKVTVNDENATVRANRLALLSSIRSSIDTVADFSQIEG